MSREPHKDREIKPPLAARDALLAWLDAKGLHRAVLCEPLVTHQTQVARVLQGIGYLSATQRRAVEQFTSGAITAKMLEGKARVPPAPKQVPPPRPSAAEGPTRTATPAPPDRNTPEDIQDVLAKLAPTGKAMLVSALRDAGILPGPDGQMHPAKSEALRQRCREWAFAEIAGKPLARERVEEKAEPVAVGELLAKLATIEHRLTNAVDDGMTAGGGI
jgi:hypothetical protein